MPETPTPLRVGVIGVGAFGRNHARVYHDLQADPLAGVQLVGVVDSDSTHAQAVANEFGTRAVPSISELLEAGVNAVSVAVPTLAHLPVARQLMQAGVDVLIEKPLCGTLPEAAECNEALRQYCGR